MSNEKIIPFPPPRIIAEVGGPIDETRVTLGIHGDDLDPDEITALLKCIPTHTHRRGDPRPRSGTPWPKGAWLLSVEGKAPLDPQALLETLLAKLPDDPSIWESLHERFTVRLGFGLFLDAWNRGFDLAPALVHRVAKMRLPLGFDIYVDGEEHDG
jgi:hypothetical protein